MHAEPLKARPLAPSRSAGAVVSTCMHAGPLKAVGSTVGSEPERERRGEHVHACGAPQGSTVGSEPERGRRGEHLHACWAGTYRLGAPTRL